MHNSLVSHRLPDELIIAIFSDSSLNELDLCQLCLVSRRFLPTVRQELYGTIRIGCRSTPDPRNFQLMEYDAESWSLLRTLKANPNLAQEVGTIYFFADDITPVQESYTGWCQIPAREVVARIISLASNAKHLQFAGPWFNNGGALMDTISHLRDLENLVCDAFHQEELARVAKSFPRLKHLELTKVVGNAIPLPTFPSLELLEIYNSHSQSQQLYHLITATSSTLRCLALNLDILLDLDYSEFPRLHTLVLGPVDRPRDDSLDSYRRLKVRFDAFFVSLAKAPKLDTLVFQPEPFSEDYDDLFLPSHRSCRDDPTAGRPLLEGLETIKFETDVSLDRVVRIIQASWARNVKKMVMPSTFVEGDGADIQADAMRGMLGPRDIELILEEF
ncbi:uncharacterized protein JCM6883_005315 [Sporobolomyces salmoneus]|uniref:uncharacterized protein n=1 Tax=Sporobolomyces salmoneus TaxID=183962 RepID=UPI00316F2F65